MGEKENVVGSETQNERSFFQTYIVELLMCTFTFSLVLYEAVVSQLILEKMEYPDAPPAEIDSRGTSEKLNTAADVNTLRTLVRECLTGLLLPFVGAWMDKTGNMRPVAFISLSGGFFGVCANVIGVYYWKISPWVTAGTESALIGFTGGRAAIYMSSVTYMAINNTGSQRTNRITTMLVLSIGGSSIANALSGFLLDHLGYLYSFMCIAVLMIICILLASFIEKPPQKDLKKGSMTLSAIRSIFRPRENGLTVCCLMITGVLALSEINGEVSLAQYYMEKTYKYTLQEAGLCAAFKTAAAAIGSIIFTRICTKCLKWSDFTTAVFASIVAFSYSLCMGFANTQVELYLFSLLDWGRLTQIPLLKSLLASFLAQEETGIFFALCSIAEAFTPMGILPLYNKTFTRSPANWPGLYYFLSAAINLIILVLILVVICVKKPVTECSDENVEVPKNNLKTDGDLNNNTLDNSKRSPSENPPNEIC